MRFRRQSVPRHQFRVALLALLRQTSIPKPHARIPASSPAPGNAMLATPICSSPAQTRFAHSDDPRVILNDKGAVRPRMQPRTALIYAPMGLTTSESISQPSPQSLPAFSLCQRRCRPPLRCGPCGVTAAPSAGACDGIGTGNIKAALRAGSKLGLRPASNREQAKPENP